MAAKKKTTALDRAAEIGVSIPTLSSWKRCGVNVNSDKEVRLRIGRMRSIPPTLKPEFMPKLAAKIQAPGEDPTQIDIEAIIQQGGGFGLAMVARVNKGSAAELGIAVSDGEAKLAH